MPVMEKSKVLSLEKQQVANNDNERQLQGIPIHFQNPNCAHRYSHRKPKIVNCKARMIMRRGVCTTAFFLLEEIVP